MKSLAELYVSHQGRVSDKWELYLNQYEKILNPIRVNSISLLEIGVQNGGSLEIWSKYFKNGRAFVGCDISEECSRLNYSDQRISVVIGDATSAKTKEKILQRSDNFDLIIEDGSHKSSDIIKTFAEYFPVLADGGIFIAEDLHCSYWEEYEGGIYYPYSSLSFFKTLSDIINYEHWGVNRNRNQIISGYKEKYGISISEEVLSQVSSVEFFNSVCVIRKSSAKKNKLGLRVVAGKNSEIVPFIVDLANTNSLPLSQNKNKWSTMSNSPAESYCETQSVLVRQEEEIKNKDQQIKNKEDKINYLMRQNEISLKIISSMKNSRSWKVTLPFRLASTGIKKIINKIR
jgi:SAM-dependent methyltransferase